jgi:hypothetical protein
MEENEITHAKGIGIENTTIAKGTPMIWAVAAAPALADATQQRMPSTRVNAKLGRAVMIERKTSGTIGMGVIGRVVMMFGTATGQKRRAMRATDTEIRGYIGMCLVCRMACLGESILLLVGLLTELAAVGDNLFGCWKNSERM